MGTEILHPQACFSERLGSFHVIPNHGRKQLFPNPNPRLARRTSPRSESRRREQRKSPNPSPNLVMGQVTILKRGELLDSMRVPGGDKKKAVFFHDRDLIVTGTERLGQEPASVTKEVRMTDLKKPPQSLQCDVYAGSAFSQSPSPSALPLPTFSRRKEGVSVLDDSATKDLRRLLRIC